MSSFETGSFVPQDDIIDDVDSFVAAAETLKERGAYKIYVMATHGILSLDAPRFIEESAIDEASGNSAILTCTAQQTSFTYPSSSSSSSSRWW